jgi:hypothetical protein
MSEKKCEKMMFSALFVGLGGCGGGALAVELGHPAIVSFCLGVTTIALFVMAGGLVYYMRKFS